jgi:hypothetical protein
VRRVRANPTQIRLRPTAQTKSSKALTLLDLNVFFFFIPLFFVPRFFARLAFSTRPGP